MTWVFHEPTGQTGWKLPRGIDPSEGAEGWHILRCNAQPVTCQCHSFIVGSTIKFRLDSFKGIALPLRQSCWNSRSLLIESTMKWLGSPKVVCIAFYCTIIEKGVGWRGWWRETNTLSVTFMAWNLFHFPLIKQAARSGSEFMLRLVPTFSNFKKKTTAFSSLLDFLSKLPSLFCIDSWYRVASASRLYLHGKFKMFSEWDVQYSKTMLCSVNRCPQFFFSFIRF